MVLVAGDQQDGVVVVIGVDTDASAEAELDPITVSTE